VSNIENYFLKLKNEPERILFREIFGIKTINIDKCDDIDNTLENIVYGSNIDKRIFVSSEAASFSNNMFEKYKKLKNVKIIIL